MGEDSRAGEHGRAGVNKQEKKNEPVCVCVKHSLGSNASLYLYNPF